MMGVDKRLIVAVCILTFDILLLVTAWSFSGVDLTDDVKVFVGAGKQATLDTTHGFMTSIDSSWELKPLGNRVLYYFVVIAAGAFHTNPDICLKMLALSALVVIALLFAIEVTRRFPGVEPADADFAFAFVSIAMLTVANLFFMQAEWWAVLLSFAVLWMLLTKKYALVGIAGLLSVWIIFMKLSTLMLIPSIFAAYILLEGVIHRETIIAYATGFLAGLAFVATWLVYLPHAVPDMFLSIQLARATKGIDIQTVDGLNYLLFYTINNILNAPVIGIGLVALMILFILLVVMRINKGEEVIAYCVKTLIILFFLWGAPLASILAQNEFFSYHYTILVFPAVITVLVTIGNATMPLRLEGATAAIVAIFAIWFMMNSLWSPLYAQQDAFWKGTANDSELFQERYDLSGEILYLDISSATYYLDAKSACRMVGSLPIERKLTWTTEYAENLACIENYQGTYAVAKHGSGMPSLLPNYTKIEEGTSWDLYARN